MTEITKHSISPNIFCFHEAYFPHPHISKKKFSNCWHFQPFFPSSFLLFNNSMGFVLRLFKRRKSEGLERRPAAALTQQPELMEHGQQRQTEGTEVLVVVIAFLEYFFSSLSYEGRRNHTFSLARSWSQLEKNCLGHIASFHPSTLPRLARRKK